MMQQNCFQSRPEVRPAFIINSTTGVVTVADTKLEPGSVHELLIIASDHGVPQTLESTAFLTVIISKNAEPTPQFDIIWLTDTGGPEVLENVTLGYVLARISVQNVRPQRYVSAPVFLEKISLGRKCAYSTALYSCLLQQERLA